MAEENVFKEEQEKQLTEAQKEKIKAKQEADRAIRIAWKRERELVLQGKGTRNWTKQQQQDIINRGKAYDESGLAFDGQHMKSKKHYPEYRGNPDNIQFLSKEEHFAAHNGNWQSRTNWYYDPETKERTEFEEDKLIPCKVLTLTDPVCPPKIEKPVVEQEEEHKTPKKEKQLPERENERPRGRPLSKESAEAKPKTILERIASTISNFGKNHPVAVQILKSIPENLPTILNAVGSVISLTTSVKGSHHYETRESATPRKPPTPVPTPVPEKTNNHPKTHKTPKQHNVRTFDRIKNGKLEHVSAHKSPKDENLK